MKELPSCFLRKQLPLGFALAMPFLALTVLALLTIGYLSYRNSQRAADILARQLHIEISSHIVAHLTEFLDVPHRINKANTELIEQGVLDFRDQPALQRHFWEQAQVQDNVTSIYFGNTAGGLANAGREGATESFYVIGTDGFASGLFRKKAVDKKGHPTSTIATMNDFDCRKRPWYADAVQSTGPIWSKIYILFTRQDLAISASRAVNKDGRTLLGVVCVDLFLSHLGNFLAGTSINGSGESFIMERSGMLIATSTNEKPFTGGGATTPIKRLPAIESRSPSIRGAVQELTRLNTSLERVADARQFSFSSGSGQQVARVTPLRDPYGLDWLIVTVVPADYFLAHVTPNSNTIQAVVAGTTLVLVAAASAFVARRIILPISRLNTLAHSVAKGRWDESVGYSGRICEISELSQSLSTMAGQLQRVFSGLSLEIAERKKAEAALVEQSQNYRSFFDTIDDMLFVLDQQGAIVWCNEAVIRKLGYTRPELQGQDVLMLHPAERRAEARHIISQMISGLADTCPIPVLTKNSKEIPVETRVVRGRWSEEDVVFGIVKDLSALQASEEKFSKAFLASPAPMALSEIESGRFTEINNAFVATLGYTRDEVIGRTSDELGLFPVSAEQAVARQRVTDLGYLRNVELTVRDKSGALHHGLFSAELVHLQDKALFLSVMNDITKRKQAEETIRKSLVEKETLLREVHHRVKNNLAAIIALIDMQRQGMTDAKTAGTFEDLMGRIRSMALVHEKLYQAENLSVIDIHDYFNGLVAHLLISFNKSGSVRHRVEAGGIKLTLETAVPCGMIVNELVSNTLKHAFPDGVPRLGEKRCDVAVSMTFDGTIYTLAVSDNGTGLPADFNWENTRSLGLRLVRLLGQHQLRGTLLFDNTAGTKAMLTFRERT
jgi:PAS domain S-box-containing protein